MNKSLAKLTQGCQQLNLQPSELMLKQMWQFLELLQQWNRVFSLTAIQSLDDMVAYHILDSLSLAPKIQLSQFILDIGTGAGLPGIPLALYYPDKSFVLLDSNKKKLDFLPK